MPKKTIESESNPTAAPGRGNRPRLRRMVAVETSAAPDAAVHEPAPGRGRRSRASAPRRLRPAPAPSTLWGVGLAGLGALLGLAGLLAQRSVEGIADPWDPLRLAVYALLVLGPAALCWAASQALRLGSFWLFGTLAWALFGYVLIFVPPPAAGTSRPPALGIFLLLLLAAVVAGLTPPLYALGWALFTQRVRRQDLRRAGRQATLLGLYVVACLGMALFSVFNGLNALLLFAVLALAEFFFLSRS